MNQASSRYFSLLNATVFACLLLVLLAIWSQGPNEILPFMNTGEFTARQNGQARADKTHQIGRENQDDEQLKQEESENSNLPRSVEDARDRARLLHEAFSGALQVMHRDFFREGQRLTLPSQSLDDVFDVMAEEHNVKLRWLAVNANAMNVNHKPEDRFEKDVVTELSAGENEYEKVIGTKYRYAGSITLSSSCVKCHLRNRKDNSDRKAALVISMSLEQGSSGN